MKSVLVHLMVVNFGGVRRACAVMIGAVVSGEGGGFLLSEY